MDFEYLEKIDKLKSRVLKYIIYKKRTEQEVRQKFISEDNELLNEVIDYLKEAGYINDKDYIERAINEIIALKNLSIYEIRYKLLSKGINRDIIDEYFNENEETLKEFERKSAQNIIEKKRKTMEIEDIKNYLLRKNYSYDSIKQLQSL
ncbi:MAG: RecX family transcriptional regulator [Clostridia bacterium]|nr:RecX family transcriptional regulator [Clostridia bacterium]